MKINQKGITREMEDKELEVEIQEFDGEDYFLYDKVEDNNESYSVYAKVNNPEIIIVAKEVYENDETYYELITDEEYLRIIDLCNKK